MSYRQFRVPPRIVFGNGSSAQLGELVADYGRRVFLCHGGSWLEQSGQLQRLVQLLAGKDVQVVGQGVVREEPSPELVDQLAETGRDLSADCVLSIGGGSVIDCGKALAAMLVNPPGIQNYLEGVGQGWQISVQPLPFLAMPTTAGSGAEATSNAVISDMLRKYKKSFRHERLLARLVILDAELTLSLPPRQTAYSGLDAVSQLLEAYVTIKHNPFSASLAGYFLPLAVEAMFELSKTPHDLDSRAIMSQASLASGMALANSGLGAVHGFAASLGGMYPLAHGLICAVLLPHVCRFNSRSNPGPYMGLSLLLSGGRSQDPAILIETLQELNHNWGIPDKLNGLGVTRSDVPEIVKRALGSASMSGNPVKADAEDWCQWLQGLL